MSLLPAAERLADFLRQEAIAAATEKPSIYWKKKFHHLGPALQTTLRVSKKVFEGTYHSQPVHYLANTTLQEMGRDLGSHIPITKTDIRNILTERLRKKRIRPEYEPELEPEVEQEKTETTQLPKNIENQRIYDPLFEELITLGHLWNQMIENEATLDEDAQKASGPSFQEMIDKVSHFRKFIPNEELGRIDYTRQDPQLGRIDYTELSPELAVRIIDEAYLRSPDIEQILDSARNTEGIIQATQIMGTVVFLYDSLEELPTLQGFDRIFYPADRQILGGYLSSRENKDFGALAVDLNPNKYPGYLTPLLVLKHELSHHIFHLLELVIKTLKLNEDPELLGFLIGRDVDQSNITEELRLLTYERSYLNELHSQFIEGDPSFFQANLKIYTSKLKENGVGAAYHWEALGSPNQEKISRYFLSLVQGVFVVSQFIKDENKIPTNLQTDYLKKDLPDLFYFVAGCLQVSLGVAQAWRLIKPKWDYFIDRYPEVAEYLEKVIIPEYTASGKGLENMSEVLLNPNFQPGEN